MSTKTIAIDSRIYSKLALHKRESESFSKAIDRILQGLEGENTGRDILAHLEEMPSLSAKDARSLLKEIAESRKLERWEEHDLR